VAQHAHDRGALAGGPGNSRIASWKKTPGTRSRSMIRRGRPKAGRGHPRRAQCAPRRIAWPWPDPAGRTLVPPWRAESLRQSASWAAFSRIAALAPDPPQLARADAPVRIWRPEPHRASGPGLYDGTRPRSPSGIGAHQARLKTASSPGACHGRANSQARSENHPGPQAPLRPLLALGQVPSGRLGWPADHRGQVLPRDCPPTDRAERVGAVPRGITRSSFRTGKSANRRSAAPDARQKAARAWRLHVYQRRKHRAKRLPQVPVARQAHRRCSRHRPWSSRLLRQKVLSSWHRTASEAIPRGPGRTAPAARKCGLRFDRDQSAMRIDPGRASPMIQSTSRASCKLNRPIECEQHPAQQNVIAIAPVHEGPMGGTFHSRAKTPGQSPRTFPSSGLARKCEC